MATDLAKLVVSLEAETAKYQRELEKARTKLSRFEKESKDAVIKISQAVGASAIAAAGGFAIMAKAAIDNADNLSKLGQSVGMTTESLSQLAYAAGLSGTSQDEMANGLVKLNRAAVEAASGAKTQAEAFAALGVSVTDASGKVRSTESILLDVAEAFSQYENGAAKTAIAMDIFGKSGAKMIPFLNSGRQGLADLRAEADAFGLTVESNAAKAAEQFNDNISRLQSIATGAANQIAMGLTPTLAELTDELVAASRESGALQGFVTGLSVAFEAVIVLGAEVAFVFQAVGREIGGIAAQVIGLGTNVAQAQKQILTGDFSGAAESITRAGREWNTVGDAMKADAAEARKNLDSFTGRILGARDAAEQVRTTMSKWAGAIDKSRTGTLAEQREVMLGLAKAYQAGEFGAVGSTAATKAYQQAVAQALPAIQKKQLVIRQTAGAAASAVKELDRMTAALQQQAATIGMDASQVELYKLKMAGASAEQLKFAEEVQNALKAFDEQKAALQEGKSLVEALRTPYEKLVAELENSKDLLDRGAISWETYSRAVTQSWEAFGKADEGMVAVREEAERINAIIAQTPTGKLEAQRQTMQELARAYENGRFGIAGSTEAMRLYGEATQSVLGTLPEQVGESTDLMKELTAEAARNMQGALADFLFDPFENGVEGMVDNFAKALQRMVAEAAAAEIFNALGFGAKGSSGGLLEGLFGAVAGFATGTQAAAPVFESSFTSIAGRADGGSMRAGRPYWTGEEGPELVFPGATSRILSSRDSAEFMRGRSNNINQVFNIEAPDPNAFRASERQITRRARMGLMT